MDGPSEAVGDGAKRYGYGEVLTQPGEVGVSAADEHADSFVGLRAVPARDQGGEGDGASWLDYDPQLSPQRPSRLPNSLVIHENDAVYVPARDLERQLSTPPRLKLQCHSHIEAEGSLLQDRYRCLPYKWLDTDGDAFDIWS